MAQAVRDEGSRVELAMTTTCERQTSFSNIVKREYTGGGRLTTGTRFRWFRASLRHSMGSHIQWIASYCDIQGTTSLNSDEPAIFSLHEIIAGDDTRVGVYSKAKGNEKMRPIANRK
jgi:hypothetical protein